MPKNNKKEQITTDIKKSDSSVQIDVANGNTEYSEKEKNQD